MPRIRKKTSNRQSINDRHKIQKRVRESRKKKAKQAKKNTQWKSKHKKDPGIPNDFPYKDQILAEVAEQRRTAAEEKEKRKEEKRLARQQAKDGSGKQDDGDEEDVPSKSKSLDIGSDAIASLSAKLIDPKLITKEKKTRQETDMDEEAEEEIPSLVNRDLPTLEAVLDASDVLLQVLDARDPLPFRSSYLEKAMRGKKVLLVLNKIDLCPKEAITLWLSYLRREYPTFLFRSATAFLPSALEATTPVQGKGKNKLVLPKSDALGAETILSQLASWAKEKVDSSLTVAVAGLTKAGKSCLVNSLLGKASLPVYSLSTSSQGHSTTAFPQEVTIDVQEKSIRFIDTPGIIWSADLPEDEPISLEGLRARDILLRSRGRIDRLKDPSDAVSHIVERANTEDLMLMYNLPAFSKGDSTSFLAGVARSNQLVKKRGELDLTGASKIVLRDWNTGKFARYTLPPPSEEGVTVHPPLTDADENILIHCRTKKEIRKSDGLVKMATSSLDRRMVDLKRPWEADTDSDGEDDEMLDQIADVGQESSGRESGSDDEEGVNEDEESDVEEESLNEEGPIPTSAPAQKRKRTESFTSAQPAKKVAFVSQKLGKRPKSSVEALEQNQGPKSILKKSANVTKQRPTKSNASKPLKKAPGKVANTKNSLKNKKADTAKEADAYDFTKFF